MSLNDIMTASVLVENPSETTKRWFVFTCIFLLVDYGRPQDVIPAIGWIRPALILIIILTVFIISSGYGLKANSKQYRLMWAFCFLLACHVPFARNHSLAFWTTVEHLKFMVLVLSVAACVTTVQRLKKYVFFAVLLMIYVALYSLRSKGLGSGNYFADENDLSLYINIYLPFCFFLFFYERNNLKRAVYLFGMIAGLAAIVVSLSRGGFIGLVSVAGTIWLVSSRKLLGALLLAIAALAFVSFVDQKYLNDMSSVTNVEEGTAKARIESWKAAWDMFLDNPLGVGGNNFQVNFHEYQTSWFRRGMWGRVAHSLWFTLLPELGVIGVCIYLLLLRSNVKDALFLLRLGRDDDDDIKFLKSLGRAFLCSLAAYFSSGSFLSVLYYPHYFYLIPLIVNSTNLAREYTHTDFRSSKVMG